MSETLASRPSSESVLKLAERGDIQAIEEGWLELLENPPLDPEFYSGLAERLIRIKQKDKGHDLLLVGVEELLKRSEWKSADQTVVALLQHWPVSERLKTAAAQALRGRHAHVPEIDSMIALARIEAEGPVVDGIKRFRALLRMTPGQVYQHDSWGEGVVKTLDLESKTVVIDFVREPGKTMKLEGVRKFLKYLKPGDFLARRLREPEKLRELADENPAALVKAALESGGGRMKQSAIKALLLGSIIPEKSWTSWWTKARRELRLDPMVDIDATGGVNAEVGIRSKPRTVAEEAEEIFFDADSTLAMRAVAVRSLEEAKKKGPIDAALVQKMTARLDEDFRLLEVKSPAVVLEYALLADQLRALSPGAPPAAAIPSPAAAIEKVTDYETLSEIDNVEHAMRALAMLFARDGVAGAERAAALLPKAPVRLAQAIWKELRGEEHRELAAGALGVLMNDPSANPSSYLWAVRMLLEGNRDELGEYFTLGGVVMDALSNLEDWQSTAEDARLDKEERASAKTLLDRVRTLLGARQYAALCAAVEPMSLEQAARFRRSILSNKAIPDAFRAGADRALRLTRRDLEDAPSAASAAAAAEDQPVLCTAKAKEEKTRELQDLRGVRIPANSLAIEEARKEGDLRENAGYHAAKDEQKLLMQQMLALQEALSVAQVVRAEDVQLNQIGFGTRFEAEDLDSGVKEHYTILGRWESDSDRRILSHLAPFAQQFLGRKIGEEFTLTRPDGTKNRYRALSIENALASGEWNVSN